ncbi:hypothetical protein EVAR_25154_1 [Eumeta japonica]|uniref:Uncharacterized protein n=1 Tax=Eumeta variegata TaxID=151549 RepID=A0A4C1VQB8_EUMVA|nr:hypothetical protein EVAR_25154_1 [Eumeta japonica]
MASLNIFQYFKCYADQPTIRFLQYAQEWTLEITDAANRTRKTSLACKVGGRSYITNVNAISDQLAVKNPCHGTTDWQTNHRFRARREERGYDLWSHGLLFHQALVDLARAAILLPLGIAVFKCQPVYKCSLVETAFLLLVTVSTVNMLTTVLNDSPIFPENEEEQADLSAPLLMDSPQYHKIADYESPMGLDVPAPDFNQVRPT